jgi:hypothetical protein
VDLVPWTRTDRGEATNLKRQSTQPNRKGKRNQSTEEEREEGKEKKRKEKSVYESPGFERRVRRDASLLFDFHLASSISAAALTLPSILCLPTPLIATTPLPSARETLLDLSTTWNSKRACYFWLAMAAMAAMAAYFLFFRNRSRKVYHALAR